MKARFNAPRTQRIAASGAVTMLLLSLLVAACSDSDADDAAKDDTGDASVEPGDDSEPGDDPESSDDEAPPAETNGPINCRIHLAIRSSTKIPGACEQTVLEHPLPPDLGGPGESCGYLSMLSSKNLFEDADIFANTDLGEGECETTDCVKRCLKLVRPSEQGSITILDQNSFDVTATLYNEDDLASFEKWCTEDFPKGGMLQDCE